LDVSGAMQISPRQTTSTCGPSGPSTDMRSRSSILRPLAAIVLANGRITISGVGVIQINAPNVTMNDRVVAPARDRLSS
jgi:hypothetical protein